jgi:methionyl-tRNA formyltransferase
MTFAWVGLHAEGIPALDALLAAGAPIRCVLTLRPDLAAKRSGGADYQPVCRRHNVPLVHISNINETHAHCVLANIDPDIVFVIGWHQMVREPVLRLARIGMIGAHASLLPHNRGSAPINWAIIKGERETGNTLFWLAESVDAGDMIDQMAFRITPYDTCATLYQKVATANRDMLVRLLPRLLEGERPATPQPHSDESVLRRRRPADGRIEWSDRAGVLYDFIRALTHPYPGAFSWLRGQKWHVWEAAALPVDIEHGAQPGTVLGPVVSPRVGACGQLVACGEGAIILLKLSNEHGKVLTGPELSDLVDAGERWSGE